MYLNEELKAYYQSDFQKVLSYSSDHYWELDDGLSTLLESINEHPQLQTLYSRRYASSQGLAEPMSYLRLAYAEPLGQKLQACCIKLIQDLDSPSSQVIIRQEPPQENRVFTSREAEMGCLNNPDYFALEHYYIGMESIEDSVHIAFWDFLSQHLPNL